MPERVRAGDLLRRARALYDSPSCDLAEAACGAWRGGFASGGRWMARALGQLRGGPPPDVPRGMNALGLVKYGLAGAAALACVGLACLMGCWPLLVLPTFVNSFSTKPANVALRLKNCFVFKRDKAMNSGEFGSMSP